jgi:nucleotide-binding universal stress UspA family protein
VFGYKRILVPLDGSEFAGQALHPALAVAEGMEADELLYRVAVRVQRTRELIKTPSRCNDLVAAAYCEVKHCLESVWSALSYGMLPVAAKSGDGGVARQIVEHTAENDVSLIAVCSHGLS